MDVLAILREVAEERAIDGRTALAMAEAVRLLDGGDLEVERRLLASVDGGPGAVRDASRRMLESGGKRIRPAICLLAHQALGGGSELPVDLAVACELLHNATLLHDDVIDEGDLRRGLPAARVVWSNAVSILSGDHLLVQCVRIVGARGQPFIVPFVETLERLVAGEATQLARRGSVSTTVEDYFRICEGKTASLFSWAAGSGAMAAGAVGDDCRQVGEFGWNVGLAFQLIDDVLDFCADEDRLGKSLLADIGQGKLTLPVIDAARSSLALRGMLAELARGGDLMPLVTEVAAEVHASGALGRARERAAEHTGRAVAALGGIRGGCEPVLAALAELARALLERDA
jgi:octaprenyl-diphosphate synthase